MNSSIDLRLRKKCLLLVADIAESQLETRIRVKLPFLRDRFFLKSVVDLSASTDDLDLQEKVAFLSQFYIDLDVNTVCFVLIMLSVLIILQTLHAIKSLLQLNEAKVFKEFCGLDGALERTRQQLEENYATTEYASDVESLRKEVDLLYRKKLNEEEVQQLNLYSAPSVGWHGSHVF